VLTVTHSSVERIVEYLDLPQEPPNKLAGVRLSYLVLELSQSVAQILRIPLILKETKETNMQIMEEVVKGFKYLVTKKVGLEAYIVTQTIT
jgi:hypothetical protein